MADEMNRAPDETLRAAAGLLRARAEVATPGPWRYVNREPCGSTIEYAVVQDSMDTLVADCGVTEDEWATGDAHYIATMHPGVAAALADWLDAEAAGWDLMSAAERVTVALGGEVTVRHSTWAEALTVARAVLGEA